MPPPKWNVRLNARLNERLQFLADGGCVITATAHAARELIRQFDEWQFARGNKAWASADVVSYSAWLQRTWRALGAHIDRPTLLNELQAAAVWERIIGRDIARREPSAALWNVHATAKTAIAAWRVMCESRIDWDECAKSPQADHRRMLRWARQFEQQCLENNWVDLHCIADKLCAIVKLHGKLHGKSHDKSHEKLWRAISNSPSECRIEWVSAVAPSPQQAALIDALKTADIDITVAAAAESRNRTIARKSYKDESTQWLHAAHWAREKLQENPNAKIALVAPDLYQSAAAIEYALQQVLCPRLLVAPALRGDLPYHAALGAKLSRHPLAAAALLALSPMSNGAIATETLRQLIRSPFIGDADYESTARAKLELWCRRYLPYQIKFERLLGQISDPETKAPACPKLCAAWKSALELLPKEKHSGKHPAAHWAKTFGAWLDKLGWPGERALNSDEYQTEKAVRRELQNLALLDLSGESMTAAHALRWLQRRFDEQAFQVEAHDVQVEVLGVVEAAAQQFDHVWFGGLTEADWPPDLRPNPFIAIAAQRQAGVVAASHESNYDHAANLQARLIGAASDVVLSRPCVVDDISVEPSALFLFDAHGDHANHENDADADADADANENTNLPTAADFIHHRKPKLQSFTDPRAPQVTVDAAGTAKGGTMLIQDQAKCPFRAFARHRLAARDYPPNAQGLDAAARGSLIHRALQLAWAEIPSAKTLRALGDDELRDIIRVAAEQAGKRYAVASGCGAGFMQSQLDWLVETLVEWFDLEKHRGDFVVEARESETELNLHGLQLHFKIDRIDKLNDGARALIDYKTGARDNIKNWGGERPQSPQLPLYALAQDTPPAALGYGRVRRGDCGLIGVVRDESIATGIAALDKSSLKEFETWDALTAHWREVLGALAREYLDGDARIAPIGDACANCDLHGLCRIASATA